MTDFTFPTFPARPQRFIPGLLMALLLAAAATWLSALPVIASLGLGALTLAIIVGVVVGNTLYSRVAARCDAGVVLTKQRLLRLGIVLYGFRLTFQQLTEVGVRGIIIDLLTLSSTFFIACWAGRRLLGLDRESAWLIGAGSSICGAAAILATGPVIKADSVKVSVAVATVVIFGTLAIFIYPLLYPYAHSLFSHLTPEIWGVYTGSTLHEVAQVVAAGHAVSPETENAAVIAKMLRVIMLAPFLLLLSAWVKRTASQSKTSKVKIAIPWFALLFIVAILVNSLHLLPASLVNGLIQIDNVLLAAAMAALGLTTRFADLRQAGTKPLMLGALLFIWLITGGGIINLTVQHLWA
ncbi:YeiH family protein [Erwinia tasmaniensis]|uniref:YeiH family protein n=1 Tax=Erwinia tasmaniensis TaxID=338565 RepID=UPI003A4D7CF1